MHTKMDLELVNLIDADLKWKEKGRRSMMRRPRKPGASILRMDVESVSKIQDPAVLETKKSGAAALGQHFDEKIFSSAPIKKRRLLRQSSSSPSRIPSFNGEVAISPQPQTLSPHHEESVQLVGRKHNSGWHHHSRSLSKSHTTRSGKGMRNNDLVKQTKKERFEPDDFSGIELLAAAACTDGVDHVEESSMMEKHKKTETDSYAVGPKETIASAESDGSSLQESTIPVAQNMLHNVKDEGKKGLDPTKVLRLHWDLNTVMDEWEEPCHDLLADPHSQKTFSEGVCYDEVQSTKLNLEGTESKNSEVVGAEESTPNAVCVNQLVLNSESAVVPQKGADCRIPSMKSGALSTESYQCVKHDAAISVVPLADNCTDDIPSTQGNNSVSFTETYEVIEGRTSSPKVVGAITCKTSDGGSSARKSDVVNSLIHPVKCEEFSTSTTSILRGQVIAKVESDTIQSIPGHFEPKSDRQPVSEEVMQGGCQSPKACKSDGDNKLALEDPLSDCSGSNVTQEQGHTTEGNTIDKVKAGYESPFEDGELREPIKYAWEENESEERDCVQYESDNIYDDDFGSVDYPISGKTEVSHEHGQTVEDGSFLFEKEVREKFKMVGNRDDVGQGAKEDSFKRSHSLSGFKASGYHSENVILEESECGSGKFFSERKNRHHESRTLRGNSLHIVRSPSFDVCKNGAYIQRSRSGNIGDSYFQAGRELGPEKFTGRDRIPCKGRGLHDASGQRINSTSGAWDSSSRHEYPMPKHFIGDSAVRAGGSNSIDINQSRNPNPRGAYRTFDRRPSPSDRKDSYDIHRGPPPPVRGLSRDRYRVGSGCHPKGLRRVPQDEYHDLESSYLERKVRGFSPNFNRGAHLPQSRRRSRSRSRSGSPIAWHFQKRRNLDTIKRSPENEPKFQGERHPSQKPSFPSEIEAGFVPSTRRRASPERISRCFDDRKFMDGEVRDKRLSPVRMFRRNYQFEPIGYPGRLNSDDHFHSTPRPGRLPKMTGPSRKHDEKYVTMSRARRSDDSVGVRRFRYAADDSFETRIPRNQDNFSKNTCNEDIRSKDAAGKDLPETTSKENGPRSYSDKMFTTATLSAGEQDFDKNDLHRGG